MKMLYKVVKFENFIKPVSMRMTVFWDAAPCSLVENDQFFEDAYCHHHQGSELQANF
jgi:hypothetical protein